MTEFLSSGGSFYLSSADQPGQTTIPCVPLREVARLHSDDMKIDGDVVTGTLGVD